MLQGDICSQSLHAARALLFATGLPESEQEGQSDALAEQAGEPGLFLRQRSCGSGAAVAEGSSRILASKKGAEEQWTVTSVAAG